MRKNEWTQEELDILRTNYRESTLHELMALIPDRSAGAIHTRAYMMKLRKSDEFIERQNRTLALNGENTRFKKGQPSSRKGRRQTEFMSEEAIARSAKTRFKKGNRPKTWVPIGSESITRDGYIKIKIQEPRLWKLKHRYVWEQVNGPIPKGYCLKFINADKTDVRIENLELVSMKDNMRSNSIMRYPENMRKLVRASAKLTRTINAIDKKEQNGNE